MVKRITFPAVPGDLVPEHPLHFKRHSEYFHSYTGPVRRALQTLGVPVDPPPAPQRVLEIGWHFDGGRTVRTGVCYGDYPSLVGQYPDVDPELWASYDGDALFKMKYHPARGGMQEERIPFPVFPGGFCLSIDAGLGDTSRWLTDTLPGLRKVKDEEPQIPAAFYNNGHFRVFNTEPGNYPNRERFKAALAPEGGVGQPWQDQHSWHDGVARSIATLSLVGNGASIDRKVVELCAIGTCILSDRGLEDLELPWNYRFAHRQNIFFIDEPAYVAAAVQELAEDPALARGLVKGSRQLFADCFSPAGLGKWYLEKARGLL